MFIWEHRSKMLQGCQVIRRILVARVLFITHQIKKKGKGNLDSSNMKSLFSFSVSKHILFDALMNTIQVSH